MVSVIDEAAPAQPPAEVAASVSTTLPAVMSFADGVYDGFSADVLSKAPVPEVDQDNAV